MTDARARRGVPERLLLPPAPREPDLADRWARRSYEDRRRLARVTPPRLEELDDTDRALVAGLARARLATRWRLLLAAPLLAWLVLMTIWGFGRTTETASTGWLLAGAAAGAVVWLVTAVAAARTLRRARRLLTAAEDPASRADGGPDGARAHPPD